MAHPGIRYPLSMVVTALKKLIYYFQFVRRHSNCNPLPEYNFTDCIINWLNENHPKFQNCHFGQIDCRAQEIIDREMALYELKLMMTHEMIENKTKCSIPCNYMHYGITTSYQLKMKLLEDLEDAGEIAPNTTAVVQFRFGFEGPFKVIWEGPSYGISNALTDLGGTIGLYLGLSIWGGIEIIANFFHRS